MLTYHVFPYLNIQTARSIQTAWSNFCNNPSEVIKETLCNKIRHYFMQTPMIPPEGRRLMNSLSNDELLSACRYEEIKAEGLPSQATLLFNTEKGNIRVWCTLKSFMNKNLYGELLGYPKCCITYFNNSSQTVLRPIYKARDPKLAEIGLIPCPHCLTRDANEIIKEVEQKRVFEGHYEIGEHIITATANRLMVDAYDLAVESPSNDQYSIQKYYPDLSMAELTDRLLGYLKITTISL